MKINLIVFNSSFSTREMIFVDHQALIDRIIKVYDVKFIFPDELAKPLPEGTTMVFIGSGGVEEIVAAAINKLPKYVLLIADGLNNSLAASLEILSWMRMEGRQGRVIHGNIDEMMKGMDDYVTGCDAINWLRGRRVGVIGKPSGWLIASGVDYKFLKKSWGVELLDLPLDEVVSKFEETSEEEVKRTADMFINRSAGMKEPSMAEVIKAIRLYVAVKGLCSKYELDAFTLNCFDLIPTTKTTGCLALALLNDEGIPAGCEGDIQTILTMLAVKAVTGDTCFMANPSKIINQATREMIFAHCTIAPGMTDSYVVRSHFESKSGVAIEGIIDSSKMTVVKCGGRKMEQFFISGAELKKCTKSQDMCRTQMLLQLEKPLDYFLRNSIGNHHVIIKGDVKEKMELVLMMLGSGLKVSENTSEVQKACF